MGIGRDGMSIGPSSAAMLGGRCKRKQMRQTIPAKINSFDSRIERISEVLRHQLRRKPILKQSGIGDGRDKQRFAGGLLLD